MFLYTVEIWLGLVLEMLAPKNVNLVKPVDLVKILKPA